MNISTVGGARNLDFDSEPIDPREQFLARAAARYDLYTAGKMTLEQAAGSLPATSAVIVRVAVPASVKHAGMRMSGADGGGDDDVL